MLNTYIARSLINGILKNPKHLSVAAFIFFSAWMISLPYEGQVLYTLAAEKNINTGCLMQIAMGFLITGLICGGAVKSIISTKKALLMSGAICLILSGMFFSSSAVIWYVSLVMISFFEGLWIAAWGWFYMAYTPPGSRVYTAAACLSVSAIIMIVINAAAAGVLPELGLILSMFALIISLIFTFLIPVRSYCSNAEREKIRKSQLVKPLILLCVFIFVITIDSGLMFAVINPAFSSTLNLTCWFWAVPYIAAIIIMSRLTKIIRHNYILYAAIAALGLSFIAFLTLGRSTVAYIIIDTLILGACGVNDLFWWSYLGEMLSEKNNPAKIMGIGLAANVAGVLTGEIFAGLLAHNDGYVSALAGLTVVFLSLLILPFLQKQILNDTAISIPEPTVTDPIPVKPTDNYTDIEKLNKYGLTEREKQIVILLLKGYTRQLIIAELMISESTVKTHIRNIYAKLDTKNKTELIKLLNTHYNLIT